MVKVRLARAGAKKRPYYRVVVADARSPRGGRFIEQIGTYDPKKDPAAFQIKPDRLKYWLGAGAQASETLKSLIHKHQVQNPEAWT